ncbi:MAG TPA: acetyl-CoA carboxylase biotin carboxyl carrier protein subunit [Gemmatimonadales bacterium]|jgi:pyruvate carboxylase subunit B
MKYTVEVGGKSFEVEIEGGRLLLDGRAVDATLSGLPDSALRRMVRGRHVRSILAQPGEQSGNWTLAFDGCRLPVQVLDARGRALKAAGSREGTKTATGILKAPMPGLVLRVQVEEGSSVEAGQGMVVIEAMKMENELKAPRTGTVAKVHVVPGARVEKGTLLVELA